MYQALRMKNRIGVSGPTVLEGAQRCIPCLPARLRPPDRQGHTRSIEPGRKKEVVYGEGKTASRRHSVGLEGFPLTIVTA